MTDPSFLLQRSAYAEDLMEMARDLQALVDNRTAAMEQPLSGPDLDLSGFDAAEAGEAGEAGEAATASLNH